MSGGGDSPLGGMIRNRVRAKRKDEWETDLRTEHGLSPSEIDTLLPYIDYHTRYGSQTEVHMLGAILVLPAVFFAAATYYGLQGLTEPIGLLGGDVFMFMLVIFAGRIIAVVGPLAILGLMGYYLRLRYRRNRVATELEQQLRDDPRALLEGNPLPYPDAELTDPGFRVRTSAG